MAWLALAVLVPLSTRPCCGSNLDSVPGIGRPQPVCPPQHPGGGLCYLIVQVRTGEAKSHEVPDPDPVSDWSSSCPSPLVRPPPPGLRRTGASGPGLVPMLSPPTGWWVREMPAPFLLAGSTHTPGKGGSWCAGQVGVWGEGGGAYYPARAWFARGSEVAQSAPPPPPACSLLRGSRAWLASLCPPVCGPVCSWE